jgi:asparagine synthase (glutamine-hydrolysing)
LKLLWDSVTMGTLPKSLWRRLTANSEAHLPPWYSSGFAQRLKLRDRLSGDAGLSGFELPSERDQAMGFLSAVPDVATDTRQEAFFFQPTYPYLHRSLVEFMQAIPPEVRALPGESRRLMRSALKGILPEAILKRRDKGIGAEAFCRNLIREWPMISELLARPQVCLRGYMDLQSLVETFNRARNGLEPRIADLAKTLALELWLRSIQRHNASIRRS